MSSVSDFKEEIDELLSKMTLKEKVGQLNQRLYGWEIYKKTKTGYELTDTFKEEVKRWGGNWSNLWNIQSRSLVKS